MNVTQANTVHYLLERGLLTRESAVNGGLCCAIIAGCCTWV